MGYSKVFFMPFDSQGIIIGKSSRWKSRKPTAGILRIADLSESEELNVSFSILRTQNMLRLKADPERNSILILIRKIDFAIPCYTNKNMRKIIGQR